MTDGQQRPAVAITIMRLQTVTDGLINNNDDNYKVMLMQRKTIKHNYLEAVS